MPQSRLKLVGWGYEGDDISDAERKMVTARLAQRFGGEFEIRKAPSEDAIQLPAPRLSLPASLSGFTSSDRRERLLTWLQPRSERLRHDAEHAQCVPSLPALCCRIARRPHIPGRDSRRPRAVHGETDSEHEWS